MFIWGEDDWFGGADQVRGSVDAVSDARLEAVDAGHAPWLGRPEECARLIRDLRT